ncbi:MAG: hypothetical protein ACOC2F_04505 [Bacteroidota bacterium]
MDKNDILTAAALRIINDEGDYDEDGNKTADGIKDLVDDMRVIKGPRKPENVDEAITINLPSFPKNPDTTQYNGTMLINYYYPNYSSGNANVEQLTPVAARIDDLFHDDLLDIDGYKNYNLATNEPLGPLYDPDDPEEHFMSVRINIGIIEE